jgi:hypothetical protein
LIRNAHGEDAHRFEVKEPVGVDDLRRSFCAHDELITAIDTYHECLVRAMPSAIAPVLQLLHRFNRAMTNGDADVMGQLLADDFRLVDHRSLGYDDATRQDMLDVVAAINRSTNHRGLARTYHVVSEHGMVRTGGSWTVMHDEWHEFEIAVHLAFLSEQKLTRLEMFEVDRVDDAVSRFRSLTAATN